MLIEVIFIFLAVLAQLGTQQALQSHYRRFDTMLKELESGDETWLRKNGWHAGYQFLPPLSLANSMWGASGGGRQRFFVYWRLAKNGVPNLPWMPDIDHCEMLEAKKLARIKVATEFFFVPIIVSIYQPFFLFACIVGVIIIVFLPNWTKVPMVNPEAAA